MCFLLSITLLFTLGGSKYKIYLTSHRLRKSTKILHFSHRGEEGSVEILISCEGLGGVSRGHIFSCAIIECSLTGMGYGYLIINQLILRYQVT